MEINKLVELLEDKLESARISYLNKLNINEDEYTLVLDNMLKTIEVLNKLNQPKKDNNELSKEDNDKLVKERDEEYKTWFVNSCTDSLTLDMEKSDIDDFEYDPEKLLIKNGSVGLAEKWKNNTFVISFTSEGCPSCKALKPLFIPEIEKDYEVLEIELEKYRDYIVKLGIKDIPLLMFVKDGIISHVEVGFDNSATKDAAKKYIKTLIKKHLG